MARIDQSDNWQDRHAPTISTFESLAMEAYSHLPEEFRALTLSDDRNRRLPRRRRVRGHGAGNALRSARPVRGRGISERFTLETNFQPHPPLPAAYPRLLGEGDETLGDIITHVLIHEIGHHFGLSDDDMERIEASAEEAAER